MSSSAAEPPRIRHNVVVISDLHLGEDLSVDASEQTRRDVAMASAAAADFVAHLTQRRVDGRPWRLVINGDLLDFLSVHVPLTDARLAGVRELGGLGRADRLARGAGRVPAASAVRVDLIAERHGPFFRRLARFLAAGHHLDLVAGNHDREIAHPLVAERVRAALRSHGARERDLVERLRIHDWFVHEPGVAWIEHGHQYDEQCSFEHGLAPLGPRGEVIPNVDAASVRYLGSVASVDPHSTEDWTFAGYFRYTLSMGPRGAVRLVGGYLRFVLALWQASRHHRALRARRRRAVQHELRLGELAEERGLPLASLRTIDHLRRIPVTRSMGRVYRTLMVDRLALTVLAAVAALAIGVWTGFPWALLAAPGTFALGAVAGEALSRRVPRDPSMALSLVPERIRRAAGTPLVVFGHTHQALRLPLAGGGEYINGGTWLPATRPGLLRAFTHVVILATPSGPRAELRQWREGRSRPYQVPVDLTPIPLPEPAAAPGMIAVPRAAKAAAAAAAVAAATTAATPAATARQPDTATATTTTQPLREPA
jgi:UDP-2,3-diacylglucosamine pyrophosphatase LpxH